MNETLVTLVGNAATGVDFRETASGGMARFRLAVTPRRWDRERQLWADGHTSFYTVWAWRGLASNVAASVSVGEPLLVHGRLKVREEEREGSRRTFVDVEAVAVGHDLSRGSAAFRRAVRRESPFGTETGAGPGGEPGRTPVPGPEGEDAGSPVFASEPAGDGPSWDTEPVGAAAARTRPDGAPRVGGGARVPTVRQKGPVGVMSTS
ncbi:single-stranded DNA-binding protein [Streptomyces sp. NBC_00102]|uniref:single-stranded DNA-binding protein n=1 Tax=Streptomyces sp. NBC_00102 TaxID=2975652 RepID=UPI00225512FE|nr:single-stranded DNA-binding protein [Streptomyces sp. NBC_00102]MCX5397062.1 single-stranded DNA-binding protein [Streptomyces sp. NBC_00102]